MIYGYEELQRLRDVQFCRSTDFGGVSTRTFTEREYFDMLNYIYMMQIEVHNVAEMLNLFEGFNELPARDRVSSRTHTEETKRAHVYNYIVRLQLALFKHFFFSFYNS